MKRAQISLALAALVTMGAAELSAQQQTRGERGPRGPRAGVDVETIMSLRERLELTDGQIQELDAWRAERVARRTEERARMEELRSQLRAGQIERSDVMAYREQRREEMTAQGGEARTRLEAILDEQQLEAFEGIVRERRAFARGRASARREGRQGVRGGRAGVREGRGIRGAREGARGPRDGARAPRRGPRGNGDQGSTR